VQKEFVRTITESRETYERAWSELAELEAATREAIAKLRELMAEIGAVIRGGSPPHG
jgi:hypothetical protein